MVELSEAERKLVYADFLLGRADAQEYTQAVLKHILEATKLALKYLTDLKDSDLASQQLVSQTLRKFEEQEPKEFARFYIQLLKATSKASISSAELNNSLSKVRSFIEWIKDRPIK